MLLMSDLAGSRGAAAAAAVAAVALVALAPMSATAGAPLPSASLVLPKARSKARPFNVFVP